ncbi:MAG: hypothetical protein C4539_00975 [Ignavibacteriales bacterium]|nr:MAG: hypothetical protein C4539_00975 [Ignavibacteriales bacterium]
MKKFYYVSLILIMAMFLYENTFAIPAFARKYNMTCKTCHSPFPSLKSYGEEFASNGFVLKDQETPRYFIETGDDELSLLRDIPLALRVEGYITYNHSYSERSDISAPYLIKLLSGGDIADDISYYFYFFLGERGEVAGLEDAFIMFNDIFNSNLDLFVGQFQVSDPLFKRELRLTFEDYLVYKLKVGQSNINLTYDRGLMLNYGFSSGTDVTLEILNGCGIGAANNYRIFDNDKYKNFMGRVSQDLTENIRIGAFGYYGKEEQNEQTNEVILAGPDATVIVGPFEMNLQYVERRDKNPLFHQTNAKEISTRGAFAELIFRPDGDESKWYMVGLINYLDKDEKVEISGINHKSATLSGGYLLKRNIRFVAESTYNFTEEFLQFSAGIIAAF